jgi:hypothetical protein
MPVYAINSETTVDVTVSDSYGYAFEDKPCQIAINDAPLGIEIRQGEVFDFCGELAALLKKYRI